VEVSIDPAVIATIALASIRIVTFLLVAPPFAGPAVPNRVKIGLAVALSLLTVGNTDLGPEQLDTWGLILSAGYQVLVGGALGFLVMLCFSVVQAAGTLVDFNAAFSGSVLYDPFAQTGLSPMARLYQVMATTMLFISGGALLFVAGIVRSFQAAPIEGFSLQDFGGVLLERIGNFMVAAIQIAFPLLVALFMAELVMGLLARAAPQLNLLVVGFGVKSLIVILLGAVSLPLLPIAVDLIVETAVRSMGAVFGGG
jgi:flagellar biosynthetic protein FliR